MARSDYLCCAACGDKIVYYSDDQPRAACGHCYDKAVADAARMRGAIAWALGCRADFDVPNDCEKRRYWWRTELAKRAGVAGYLDGEPVWGGALEQFTRRDLPEDAMGDYSRAGIDPHPDDRKTEQSDD